MPAQNTYIKGFSLLEVAIVITIVVLIASTALPKIRGGLQSETVSIASMAGEFDNAVRQARAAWFSSGQTGVVRIQGYGDGQVWSSERGWPMGHSGAEPPAGISASACADIWNGIMRQGDTPRVSTDAGAAWRAQASGAHTCRYIAKLGEQQREISYNARSGKVSYL